MSHTSFPPHAIAIIGMACRFPKSPTLDDFWRNVRDGVECLTRFSDEDLAAAGIPEPVRRHPQYVPVRGLVEDADRFDAGFFGINPHEAELIDPQQRLLLECAVEAFENAGYDWARTTVPVGVFAGVGANYYLTNEIARADLSGHPGAAFEVFVGNDKDFCATRLSYKLDLHGPSINVQTACSTSLVAVHMACQSLLTFQCDMALAGAASLLPGRVGGYLFAEGMILSPDGHCRPFDAKARGTIPSEGCGVVMLKRLDDALADGDEIRAVILGTGINNDGAGKAGFTAPSIDGQREAIGMALALADVQPDTIGYIETHGTGTPLGDPIEIAALRQVYGQGAERSRTCALGALKGNFGHTDTAAGMAGLIKAVLALEHREIPPTLHYEAPNPALNLDSSPFFVNSQLLPWTSDTPRRASVSSFGIGGTNTHLVIQEAPARAARAAAVPRWHVLPVSARSETALEAATRRLGAALESRADLSLDDVAFTLQQGRREHRFRRTVLCRTREEAAAAIAAGDPERVRIGRAGERAPAVMFMFSGQGAQYPGMGAGLYAAEAVFREALDECAEALKGRRDEDLRDVVLRASGDEAATRLRRTLWAQPAMFAIDYALARLWLSRGVEPAGMIGHSLGEYVAAALAGVFTPGDAMRLVAERARLMDALPGGAMTAVSLPEADVLPLLPPELSVAAVNGPAFVVVSGPTPAVEAFEGVLAGRGTTARRLHTSHAFHSVMVEPMLEPFRAVLADVRLSPPARRYVSNVTGTWIEAGEATSPEYWLRHVRQAVRFGDGIARLAGEGDVLFLECGPGRTLATLARQQTGPSIPVATSLRHADEQEEDALTFTAATATLWRHGVVIDWPPAAGSELRRVPLPTYPFDRERHWLEPATVVSAPARLPGQAGKWPVSEWFTVPTWRRLDLPALAPSAGSERWLVFADAGNIVSRALRESGVAESDLLVVRIGVEYDAASLTMRPDTPDDYRRVLAEALARFGAPTRIVHAFCASAAGRTGTFDGFNGALHVAQAVAERIEISRARLDILVAGSASVLGSEPIVPDRAAVHGIARVIPQEYPHLRTSVVDLDSRDGASLCSGALTRHLLAGDVPALVAVRGSHLWEQVFEPVDVPAPEGRPALLNPDGAYLVTGAFGNIGAQLCNWLADEGVRALVLVGRNPVERPEAAAEQRDRFVDVERLRSRGIDVLVLAADMADSAQVRRVVALARERFTRLAGVFHCAGSIRDVALPELSPGECSRQFDGKCRGLWALLEELADDRPDFVACTSSISIALGGLGFGAYAAANAALDASVEAFPAHRLISIGWDSWASREAPDGADPLAIDPREGRDAWRRLLHQPRGHVIVSTSSLHERLARWSRPGASQGEPTASPAAPPPAHGRPDLSVAYVAPRDEAETQMVRIWEDLLGISGIGVHDNFFELGGHSLLGTQLISRLRDQFAVQLPLRTIFEATTVETLARQVSGLQWAGAAGPSKDAGAADREEVEL